MTTRDTSEMKLVSQIFDFARSLAEFRLSDEQLALYSGYILLQDGKLLDFFQGNQRRAKILKLQ